MSDKRKGGGHLIEALNILHQQYMLENNNLDKSVLVITIGRDTGFDFSKISFDHNHLGLINDDRVLSLIYNAADVIASPSLDDFGPMMVNEAISCQTPVVSFDIGVASDIINYVNMSYLAKNFNIKDFSLGLDQIIKSKNQKSEEKFTDILKASYQIQKYISLFKELLINKKEKKNI